MDDAIEVCLKGTGPAGCLVTVAGELDIAAAPEVRRVLDTALSHYRQVAMDLSTLQFCDCAGLGVLVEAASTARSLDVDLRLRSIPPFLARIVRLTRAHHAFTIEPGPARPQP